MKFKALRKISAAVLAATMLFAVVSLSACTTKDNTNTSSTGTSSETPSSTAADSSVPAAPATITDREGKEITIPDNIEKIISMAPSITETLINLGLGDKIIAIDKYSAGREGLKADLPQFDIMTPDTESIAALKPDIILATGMSRADGDDPFKPVTDLGVLMTYIPSASTIQAIKDDITFLGAVTKTEDKAAEIITTFDKDMNAVLDKVKGAAGDTPKNVYFEIAAAPSAYSFGTDTFLNEMIELLGAKNVLADQSGWLSVTEEVAISKNPDVIFTNVDYLEDPVAEIIARNGWNVVNAVKNKQVYQIDKNASSLPNENVAVALEQMAKAIYPEAFK